MSTARGEVTFGSYSRRRDRAALEAMVLALYREDAPGRRMTRAKIARTVAELARRPHKGRIVVFRGTGGPAGYAIVIFAWSNELGGDVLVIDELYVEPGSRGRGIASRFLRHLAAGGLGPAAGLQLEVTPGNARAAAWYRRLGFRPLANTTLVRPLAMRSR